MNLDDSSKNNAYHICTNVEDSLGRKAASEEKSLARQKTSQFELLTPAADASCVEVSDTELASILQMQVTLITSLGFVVVCRIWFSGSVYVWYQVITSTFYIFF